MEYKIKNIGIGFPSSVKGKPSVACGYAALSGDRIAYFGSVEELAKALGIGMEKIIAGDTVYTRKPLPVEIIHDQSIQNIAKLVSDGKMLFETYQEAAEFVFRNPIQRAEHMGRIMNTLLK